MPIDKNTILLAFPGLTPETRDDGLIAATLSAGRTKVISPTLVGIGTILRVLGPIPGAAFLDGLEAAATGNTVIKWGLVMIQASNMDIGDELTRQQIDAFVGTLLTAEQADSLKSVAVVPDPVTASDVAAALEGFGD